MNELQNIGIWATAVVLLLIIVSILPGIKLLLKPLLETVASIISKLGALSSVYLLWLAKLIVQAHIDIVHHLAHDDRHFDVTKQARKH